MSAIGLVIEILAYVLLIAIFIRIIFSWTGFDPSSPIYRAIFEVTEPILGPLRSILPRAGMFDLSPMIASFLLIFLAQLGSSLRT